MSATMSAQETAAYSRARDTMDCYVGHNIMLTMFKLTRENAVSITTFARLIKQYMKLVKAENGQPT